MHSPPLGPSPAPTAFPQPPSGRATPSRAWLAAAVLLAWAIAAGEPAQAQVAVTLPNGGAQLQGPTLSYGSSGGGSSGGGSSAGSSGGGSGLNSGNGGLRWDGREWKFATQWESLSQSWKNLTGSQMGLGSTGSGGAGLCAAEKLLAIRHLSQ